MELDRAAELVGAARRITVLTGAGISTDSGIPDFRGPNGIWTREPAAAQQFTLDAYLNDPEVRRDAWRRRAAHPVWRAEPNEAHRALVDLERSGRLRALLTQNIDRLHQRAGSDPDLVIELHGNMYGTVCADCGSPGSMRDALERVAAGEEDPECPVCGGVLRSTTVSFGQPLDDEVLRRARTATLDCELFLAAGTSLSVYPAAGLVGLAARAGAQVVICNAEPTPYDDMAAEVVRGALVEVLPALVRAPAREQPPDRAPLHTWGDPATWT
ncbi:NAD-dependent protein deacetylase 2 [Gandjariella thermophila]|uniref:protein acetyllysine N-acetyltransferase n=1 Tax=Gandjariella thermophila TaxID=1931992 RepID=A0A4D4J0E9_9PSEU|nr:NAD-dependent protein deacetylase 2 [Gandjariella thermophila]